MAKIGIGMPQHKKQVGNTILISAFVAVGII